MNSKHIICGVAALVIALSGGVTVGGFDGLSTEIAVSAAESVTPTFSYSVDETNNTAVISKYSGSDTSVTIPSAIDGYKVSGIADYAFNNCNMTMVEIPNGVEWVGGHAFSNCPTLVSVTFPDSVKSIGVNCFYRCSSLTKVTLPASLNEIKSETFEYCTSLRNITIPYGVTSIGVSAFNNCTKLLSITLPNSVTNIKNSAFAYCKSLSAITLSNKLTSIGENAFRQCTELTSVAIPDSVTELGKNVFYDCASLSSVTLPKTLQEIPNGFFYNCQKLNNVTIPGKVTDIGEFAFYKCTSLKSVVLPNSVLSIKNYAFKYCKNISGVTLNSKLLRIGDEVFYGCDLLTSIRIPESVAYIGNRALGYYYDFGDHKYEHFSIICKKGSEAEMYAEENGINYVVEEPLADLEDPDVKYSVSTNSIDMKWNSVAGAQKYAVCVRSAGKWQKVSETTGNSYTLTGLKSGTQYTVAVISMFNDVWNTSYKKTYTFTTKSAPAPVAVYPKVKTLTINSEFHQVKIDWEGVSGAEQYGIAMLISGKWKVQGYSKTASFTTPKLQPGEVYTLVICAKVNGKWDTSKVGERAFKLYAL